MICIVWDGFPQYGARCVRALVEGVCDGKVVVVGRRPAVPDKGMESICGCPVIWIDNNEHRRIADICGEMPRFISIAGWKVPVYDQWRDEVRASGGIAICGSDNNYPLDGGVLGIRGLVALFKLLVGAMRFRISREGRYDGFFVPGKSGRRLFRFYGVENERIAEGSYSADATLYFNGQPLRERERRIIYVGQFVCRKNVVRMVRAFESAARKVGGGWTLELYGSGELRSRLEALSIGVNASLAGCRSCVKINDFVRTEQLAPLYRRARIFCLPSLEEHWGLVVHEAALSGCVLLLGRTIGAAADLLGGKTGKDQYANGFSFDPYSTKGLEMAMMSAMTMDDASLDLAQSESLRKAKSVSIDGYVSGIRKLMSLERR